ncbi:IclR family transcriptional regulator [Xylophilus sp. GOD-11R]|uniref:IclR family transcriptional regulator n=1 Tax=Xylophilus sp. GOD-11R TaxID=3089814 RepID=UPI00298C93A0|nr:IclR family transcriptional regulator [Xylophilus sp. GOD-11R]WPB56528.1 IclR family transcriptional regulator [Xylophilus sp. GOD-11R]
MPPTDNLFVQSIAKAMAVLEALGSRQEPLSLNELAERADMDRSTAQRIAHTLTLLGYLEKGPNGRGIVLGKKLLDRTFDFLNTTPLVERATPILADLQRETGERVDLSLFDDLSIIYALRRQSKRETFFATLVGRRIPTYCSSGGRAVMSFLADERVDDILDRSDLVAITPKTVTDKKAIKQKVAEARQLNYSLCLEESILGEIALGCAILDADDVPIAAVHIAGSCSEWTADSFTQRFAPLAIEAARALGRSRR